MKNSEKAIITGYTAIVHKLLGKFAKKGPKKFSSFLYRGPRENIREANKTLKTVEHTYLMGVNVKKPFVNNGKLVK